MLNGLKAKTAPPLHDSMTPPPHPPRLPPLKLWCFRVIAFVVLPLLVLGAAETALRIGGYGYSTAFFKRIRIGNEDFRRRWRAAPRR